MTAPAADEQVAFLANIQRLLAEGSFNTTYKHALLLALADLSVEIGDDTGDALPISISAIAEKIVQYYWRQALSYPAAGRAGSILQQSRGRPAVIVRRVADARAQAGESLATAKAAPIAWTKLVAEVADTVEEMPLWRLQRVGNRLLDFLYAHTNRGGHSVELRPGVAYCFRRFHSLVEDMVRGAWVRFMRDLRHNQPLFGEIVNLDEFLFGSERADLSAYGPILNELQEGRCFYCGDRLDARTAVDHFIPWSRYPVDFGHNFVLSHGMCNGKKADRIAAVEHLARWSARNRRDGATLGRAFAGASIFADQAASIRITRWAYEQIEASNGLVWVSGENVIPLDARWRAALDVTI